MLNQSLYKIFSSEKLHDLLIVGYGDTVKGFKNFNAVMNSVFLIFGDITLRVESYDQYSKLRLSIADENAYSEACVRDEDDELIIFPALKLYTRYETSEVSVATIKLFFDQECDIEAGVYRALGIMLSQNAGYLFFDPMNLSGILIGSQNQEMAFIENWEDLQAKKGFDNLIQESIAFADN